MGSGHQPHPGSNDGSAAVQADLGERRRGIGPFVTLRDTARADGTIERWESRWHRKHLSGAPLPGPARWAPRDRDWWIGVLFAVGSSLFALGVVPSYAGGVGTRPDAVTFFAGSVFFTSAGFLQYREAVDASQPLDAARRKVFVFRPRQIDWLATGAQLIGTGAFNISTAVAIWAAPGTALERHYVWRPDTFGSVCFLLASGLAWLEVCHGWAAWRPQSLGWWVGATNLAGSVAFGVSAVASYISPGSTQPLSESAANLGTFAGAVCFFAGAVLLLLERAEPAPTALPAPS